MEKTVPTIAPTPRAGAPVRSDLPPILAALALLIVAYFVVAPGARDASAPLPWDNAHHYLGGLEFRDALRATDPHALRDALLGGDLYPPGNAVWLGAWLLILGTAPASHALFGLSTLLPVILATFLLARTVDASARALFVLAAAVIVVTTLPLVSLAATFMVEPSATALAMGSLALMALAWQRPTAVRLALTCGLTILTLLTKYNVGLPLLPCLALAALGKARARDFQAAFGFLVVALVAAGAWAAFLTLQDEGWHNFQTFAKNRANSTDWSPVRRAVWYLRTFADDYALHPVIGVAVLVLAVAGVALARTPAVVLSGVYVALTLGTLAFHPYLLDRNIHTAAAIVSVPAAAAIAVVGGRLSQRLTVTRRRILGASTLVASCLLVVLAVPRERALLRRYYPPSLSSLAPLSERLERDLAGTNDALLIGTFNEFSAGWARILWRAHHQPGDGSFHVELDYPLDAQRDHYPPHDDARYAAQATAWADAHPGGTILALDVAPNSPWWTDDYQRWAQWKRNYIRALQAMPRWAVRDSTVFADTGVTLRNFQGEAPAVEFVRGWSPVETWGRWAMENTTALRVHGSARPDSLRIVAAPFEGLQGPQTCEVTVNQRPAGTITLTGTPWEWQTFTLPLDACPPTTACEVTLTFAKRYHANPADTELRALPVQSITLVSGSDR